MSGYRPNCYESFDGDITVDGTHVSLNPWDTQSQDDFARLRVLAYDKTDVFLVGFAIDRPCSFSNVLQSWIPEIMEHSAKKNVILVGLKSDLRSQKDKTEIVASETAERLAKEINAQKYMECSALNNVGVDEIFKEAARLGLSSGAKKLRTKLPKRCELL